MRSNVCAVIDRSVGKPSDSALIYPWGYYLPMTPHPAAPTITGRPAFLFDADCGVCQNGTDTIRDRIDPPVDIIAWQTVDLDAWGVTEQAVHEGPVFVDTDGTQQIGPLGMARMLRRSRAPYRFVGAAMLTPGVRHLLDRIGPWMYRHRDRLPGSTPACSV